jgi:8-oxo-dGTP pyrophosphatase MutT (NUDIX family)
MEKVDVVDENLKVLYSITKNEAHEKGLLHPIIIAEVINSKGEWMLTKQAKHKQDPGKFVSPVAGHIKSGESEIRALKRETKEELNLSNFKYKRIGQLIYNSTAKIKTKSYYIIFEIYSDEEPTLNNESVEFRRFSIDELKKLFKQKSNMFGDAFHYIIENLYSETFSK